MQSDSLARADAGELPAEDRPIGTGRARCSLGELLGVGLLAAALILTFYAFGTERVGLDKDDAGEYVQMAESPASLVRLPYTFRALSPLLAGAWPGGSLAGFTLVTLVSLTLACVALHAYQRVLGLSLPAALAGALLFSVSGGAIRMLTTPVYVDAASYLAESAAFLFLATGHFWLFLAAVTLGVLNRETGLLLIPLFIAVVPGSWRSLGRGLLIVAIPAGAFAAMVILRLWAGGVLGGAIPLPTLTPHERAFRQEIPPLTDLFDLFSAFGVLWLLALKNLPGPTRFQRRALLFGALVILQLIVARGDEGRVLSHLFVIVVPLAMLEVERVLASGWHWRGPLAILLVLACAASMIHSRWTFVEPAILRYAIVAMGSGIAVSLAAAARRTKLYDGDGKCAVSPNPTS